MLLLLKRFFQIKIVRLITLTTILIYGAHHIFQERHQHVLRVLTWADVFPLELLQRFEKEHNVRLILDYFDSQEVLETKLSSGFSGYDLITPTATPFVARYIQKNLLQPINKSHLKNYKNIVPLFIDKIRVIDPTADHIIPFGYGTFGILYNKTMIDRLKLPSYPTHYGYFFDPKIVANWGQYGIGMLNEFQDVFGSALGYLGYPSYTQDSDQIYEAYTMLSKARPHIRRFSNNRYINDLLVEELIYAQALSDEANRAVIDAREHNIELVFIRPPHEKGMYVDCFAIPTTAKTVKLAEKFLDFCLEVPNALQITKHSRIPNSVSHRYKAQLDPESFLDTAVEELNIPPMRPYALNRKLLVYWRHFLQKLPVAPKVE